MISIIVAIAKNNAIGKDNDLLWHIPEDLKRFKELTLGHCIVMGKNTWYSLPKRPLKDRVNIVLTDDPCECIEGCISAYSIEDPWILSYPQITIYIKAFLIIYNKHMGLLNI